MRCVQASGPPPDKLPQLTRTRQTAHLQQQTADLQRQTAHPAPPARRDPNVRPGPRAAPARPAKTGHPVRLVKRGHPGPRDPPAPRAQHRHARRVAPTVAPTVALIAALIAAPIAVQTTARLMGPTGRANSSARTGPTSAGPRPSIPPQMPCTPSPAPRHRPKQAAAQRR